MFQNELNTLHLNPKGNGSLALNFINKIRRLWWSSEHLNVPTMPSISPSKSLNKKIYISNLRISEIPNYITCESKHLKNNCSSVNKNEIDKNDKSCNTLQKLRVNNSLRIIVGQLNISSIRSKFEVPRSIFEQKYIYTFGFWNPNWSYISLSTVLCTTLLHPLLRGLTKHVKEEDLLLYVRDDIPSKQIKLKFIENFVSLVCY